MKQEKPSQFLFRNRKHYCTSSAILPIHTSIYYENRQHFLYFNESGEKLCQFVSSIETCPLLCPCKASLQSDLFILLGRIHIIECVILSPIYYYYVKDYKCILSCHFKNIFTFFVPLSSIYNSTNDTKTHFSSNMGRDLRWKKELHVGSCKTTCNPSQENRQKYWSCRGLVIQQRYTISLSGENETTRLKAGGWSNQELW